MPTNLKKLDSKSLYQAICIALYCWRSADIIKCLQYSSLVYTQHCLQNVEDTNNSRCNFLQNVDLSDIFLHATVYLRIMTDFNLKDTNL